MIGHAAGHKMVGGGANQMQRRGVALKGRGVVLAIFHPAGQRVQPCTGHALRVKFNFAAGGRKAQVGKGGAGFKVERHGVGGLEFFQGDALQGRVGFGRGGQYLVNHLVGGLAQPGFAKAHSPGQQSHHLPVAFALAQRRDGRVIVGEVGVAVPFVQINMLKLAGGRQHNIGVVGSVGYE